MDYMNGFAMVSITIIVKIIPITIIGIPAFNISFIFTYPVPYAIATVGSAIGNMNESEHAIATGTA